MLVDGAAATLTVFVALTLVNTAVVPVPIPVTTDKFVLEESDVPTEIELLVGLLPTLSII